MTHRLVLLRDETEPRYELIDVGGPDTDCWCETCGRSGIRYVRTDYITDLDALLCERCVTEWLEEIATTEGQVLPK